MTPDAEPGPGPGAPPGPGPGPAGDSTLDRLIRILGAFDADRPTLPVASLARRAALPLPTAYRWVDRLTASGLLERHADSTVGPGLRLWELVARSAPTTTLRDAARPFMDDVQAVLRQHTQLAVLDDAGVLILERLSARGAVANQATVAGRLPTFTTALGLVLLAHSRRHVLEAFLQEHGAALGGPWSGSARARPRLAGWSIPRRTSCACGSLRSGAWGTPPWTDTSTTRRPAWQCPSSHPPASCTRHWASSSPAIRIWRRGWHPCCSLRPGGSRAP